jgi:hypothetical protein
LRARGRRVLDLLQAQSYRLTSPGGEFLGDLSTATEVQLVGCLTFERPVGNPLVVLGHIERTEPLDGRELVERVEESQRYLSERHQASMSELEKLTSI